MPVAIIECCGFMRQFLYLRVCLSLVFLPFSLPFLHAQVTQQSNYQKVQIFLEGRSLRILAEAGLEVDHGLSAEQKWLINDYSEEELATVRQLGFRYKVLQDDVASWYARQDRPSELVNVGNRSFGACDGKVPGDYPYTTPSQYEPGSMGGYFTYEEMLSVLDLMAKRYPNIISQRENIPGFTTQKGNQIFYVRMSDDISKKDPKKPKVLYTALHHAREPNSLSQMLFYLWYLLENYGKDDTVDRILRETELYFVPCINPDGYLQNQSTHPNGGGMWRKNMWVDGSGNLKGVDLNRNYSYFWGVDNAGSSGNPNSQTFRGPSAFSEPETQAIRYLCLEVPFAVALNYHTFGNYLIHPWGYNDEPTSEDALFKAMGSVMNRESGFLMGTGVETVGYLVNGDSDDWMYGENTGKPAIYSMTPEVGPSFWPPAADIDQLNKSCVWMNLSTALLTLSYYTAEERVLSKYVTPEFQKIAVRVSRAGLRDGASTVTLTSATEGVSVIQPNREIRLAAGESENLLFDVEVDAARNYETGIEFLLVTNNEGLLTTQSIRKEWLPAPLRTVFTENINNIQAFSTSTWESTTQCVSPPFALTDSESGTYKSNEQVTVTLTKPVDLSGASKAVLTYYAKWDIESQYDFAQVGASTDSIDFIPLCGKYTRAGGVNQDFNSPVYDGMQSEWVKEEVDLNLFAGQEKVWIRFQLVSDEYAEKDGFYFDELEVLADIPLSGTAVGHFEKAELFPSLVRTGGDIHLRGIVPDHQTFVDLLDNQGRILVTIPVTDVQLSLLGTGLQPGFYLYRIRSAAGWKGSGKLVLID